MLVPCFIDTGYMVTTVTETFFLQHFDPLGHDQLQPCAANGLLTPYVGYIELEVELCGKSIPECGILVVKDPRGPMDSRVPGVLGMNVLGRCYRELFCQQGSSLFEVTSMLQAPAPVVEALQQCHQVELELPSDQLSHVKVRGGHAVRVPSGTMKLIPSTCSTIYAKGLALFEPPESGPPAGLLASHGLVRVVGGTASIPVVNVSTTDVILLPHTLLGMLQHVYVVSLPAEVIDVLSVTATVSSHAALEPGPSIQEQIEALELPTLSGPEGARVKALLEQYQMVFSAHDAAHDIALIDDVPI